MNHHYYNSSMDFKVASAIIAIAMKIVGYFFYFRDTVLRRKLELVEPF